MVAEWFATTLCAETGFPRHDEESKVRPAFPTQCVQLLIWPFEMVRRISLIRQRIGWKYVVYSLLDDRARIRNSVDCVIPFKAQQISGDRSWKRSKLKAFRTWMKRSYKEWCAMFYWHWKPMTITFISLIRFSQNNAMLKKCNRICNHNLTSGITTEQHRLRGDVYCWVW